MKIIIAIVFQPSIYNELRTALQSLSRKKPLILYYG